MRKPGDVRAWARNNAVTVMFVLLCMFMAAAAGIAMMMVFMFLYMFVAAGITVMVFVFVSSGPGMFRCVSFGACSGINFYSRFYGRSGLSDFIQKGIRIFRCDAKLFCRERENRLRNFRHCV